MGALFENSKSQTHKDAVKDMHNIWGEIYTFLGKQDMRGGEAGTWENDTRPSKLLPESEATDRLLAAAGTEPATIVAVARKLRDTVHALVDLTANARLRAVTGIVNAHFVAVAIMLRDDFPAGTRNALMAKWEKVTFRIYGLARKDSRSGLGEFVRLGYDIAKERLPAPEIEKRLDGLLASDTDDFDLDRITQSDLFDDCYTGWEEQLRYLLIRYDEHLAKNAGQKLNENLWKKIWGEDTSKSIEHISPQSAGKRYMHHLGNLALLPPGVNSSLSDKPPAEKAKTYEDDGILGTVEVGKMIRKDGKWTEITVRERQKLLLEFIRKEWG